MLDFIKTKTGIQFTISCLALIIVILFLSTINYRSINKINNVFDKTLTHVKQKDDLKKLTLHIDYIEKTLKHALRDISGPLVLTHVLSELTVFEKKVNIAKQTYNADVAYINKLTDLTHQIRKEIKNLDQSKAVQLNAGKKEIYKLFEQIIAMIETQIKENEDVIRNQLMLRKNIYYRKTASMITALIIITILCLIAIVISLKKMFYFKQLIAASITLVANGKEKINLPLILSEIASSIDIMDASLQKALEEAERERKINAENQKIIDDILKENKENDAADADQANNLSTEVAEETEEIAPLPEPAMMEPLPTMKALIIEDNETSMRLAQTLLYNINCNVDQAKSGKEALKLITQEQYDIILLDINLPDINGYNVTKIIRQKLGNKTPIVAISSLNDPDNIKKALTSGMNDFIHKPLSMRNLRQKLEKLVPKKAILWS